MAKGEQRSRCCSTERTASRFDIKPPGRWMAGTKVKAPGLAVSLSLITLAPTPAFPAERFQEVGLKPQAANPRCCSAPSGIGQPAHTSDLRLSLKMKSKFVSSIIFASAAELCSMA